MAAHPLSDAQLARIRHEVRRLVLAQGIDGWRVSDLVATVGISSRTLYKYFPTKEYLVLQSLVEGAGEAMRSLAAAAALTADGPERRAAAALAVLSRELLARPPLARAMVRALTCGQPEVAPLVMTFNDDMLRVVASALAGDEEPTTRQLEAAELLQQVWFAAVVAWAAGIRDADYVDVAVARALALVSGSCTTAV